MERTLQTKLRLPHETEEYEETHDTRGCIAIDANIYHILLTLTASDGTIVDTLEAKPHQIPRVSKFVRQHKRYFPDLHLTGVRTDRWPPGLLPALVLEFGPIRWVPDLLLKRTMPEFRRSTRFLKFLRAMFLAACAHHDYSVSPPPTPQSIMVRWKIAALDEASSWLAVEPPDDIPF